MNKKKLYTAPDMEIMDVIVETAMLATSQNPFEGSTQGTEEIE